MSYIFSQRLFFKTEIFGEKAKILIKNFDIVILT